MMMSKSARCADGLGRRAIAGMLFVLGCLVLAAPPARAVPSMGNQTGYACSRCHTVFPELTPYGRQFKLGGFTASSSKWDEKAWSDRLPVAVGLLGSRTSTNSTSAGGTAADEFPKDRKAVVQTAAVYYGGKIYDNVGALIQYNYEGIEKRWGIEMFDARYANSVQVAEKDLVFGVTVNNNPTVSDIYNSTSAWGFPHTGTAAEQMPATTLVDMTLASKVGGVGVYGMWDDLVYLEVAAYRTAKSGALRFASWGQNWNSDELAGSLLDGSAPYVRLALQKELKPHSFAVGIYGLRASLFADANNRALGTNRFRDVGYDANYQYIEGDHSLSLRANWIREKQTFNDAFVGAGLASNPTNTLRTFRADVHYYFQRQWGGGVQYFRTSGSSDDLRYNTGDALFGSTNGSPNTKGWMAEVNYLPWENLKLALRVTQFQQFNGARTDYTPGRSASDNNNLFVMGWLLF
ncbi:MAG: cytochrome C [Rubrivivax sp.]|nr:cytochrome C [Rubrivivax sp.]